MASGQGIRAGAAYVELFTDDSRLIRGLRAAQGRLRAFGAAVHTIGAGLTTAGAWMTGLGLAAVGGLGMAARSFAKTGDALVEMSQRTGLSVETLSELDLAARKSGIGLDEVGKAVRRLQVVITNAADGSKSAAKALAEVGLSARDLVGKGTEEQFKAVADAISRIPDASARAAAAVTLFGRAGTQMLPFIKDGRAGIEAFQTEARALGLTISGEAAQAAHEFSHTLETLWAAVKRAAFEVGSALGPALQDVAKWLIDAARSAAAWVR
jgi:predicted HAD superfamily Cof-like phosphohydrolase